MRPRVVLDMGELVRYVLFRKRVFDGQGLFDRFIRYFGQPADSFPKTWSQLSVNCELLVFTLARIGSWTKPLPNPGSNLLWRWTERRSGRVMTFPGFMPRSRGAMNERLS